VAGPCGTTTNKTKSKKLVAFKTELSRPIARTRLPETGGSTMKALTMTDEATTSPPNTPKKFPVAMSGEKLEVAVAVILKQIAARAADSAREKTRDQAEAPKPPDTAGKLTPDLAAITSHIYALCDPAFTHSYSFPVLEIAYGDPKIDGGDVNQAQTFAALSDKELQLAAQSAAKRNASGYNAYVGAALRYYGDREIPPDRRATVENYLGSRFAWVDFDKAGDADRIDAVLREKNLTPHLVVTTGTIPHRRGQLYFLMTGIRDAAHLREVNSALQRLLGSDPAVIAGHQVLRLAGGINHPTEKKRKRGYVPELTTLRKIDSAPTYSADHLISLAPAAAVSSGTEPRPHCDMRADDFFGVFDDYRLEADPDMIATAMEFIPNNDLEWDEWKRIMLAAWRATNGDERAFAAIDRWSSKSGKYDAKETRRQWDKIFKKPPTNIGAGTIFKLASDNGWERPGAGHAADVGAKGTDAHDAKPASSVTQRVALPLTYFGEFGNRAKKRPILKGLLNRGETSALIAPPKRGKSGLATEFAIHCAAGIDWRGHIAGERCGVVIFALERADLYRRRLDAYQLRDGHKDLPIAVAGKVIDLLNPACVATIVATLREAEARFGCSIGLMVFDTYSKGIAAGGGDENSAKDQNRVAANLRRIQELIDVHILCVGHTGKDPAKGARGSNAHLGDVDLMIQITGDTATKTATVTDANDQPERIIAQFRLEPAETGNVDDDGEVETVSILAIDEVSSPDTGKAKLSDVQQAALKQLWECIADGETAPLPNNPHVPVRAKGITLETWRKRLEARAIFRSKNHSQEFSRIHNKLQILGKIGIWDEFVWAVS
jgi:hypothetical protein